MLVLVLVVYELVDDFEMWIKPKLAKLVVARVDGDGSAKAAAKAPT